MSLLLTWTRGVISQLARREDWEEPEVEVLVGVLEPTKPKNSSMFSGAKLTDWLERAVLVEPIAPRLKTAEATARAMMERGAKRNTASDEEGLQRNQTTY